MPDLDPQPTKLRGMSPARWLLMLLPSVPMLVSPLVAETRPHLPPGVASEKWIGLLIETCLFSFGIAAFLSILFGFLLEKWRHGGIKKISRTLSYAFQILVTNCFIAFLGCGATTIGLAAKHP